MFADGIDWQTFAIAFQDLQIKYGDSEISIQALEIQEDGTLAIRIYVPSETDRSELLERFERDYQAAISALDKQYRSKFNVGDEQICQYRQHSTDLLELVNWARKRSPF